MSYLQDIGAWTAAEVARRRHTRSLLEAIGRPGLSVIAEFKRASPSQGTIVEAADPGEVALAYREAGAAAISVLTSARDFGGSLADLGTVRAAVDDLPILAKDFFVSTWQVTEARAHGADAILLLLALVDDGLARDLITVAEELDMDVLCEVHDDAELRRALDLACPIIGVNARDLSTLTVDPENQRRLLRMIPAGFGTVAESGIASAADARAAQEAGARAILVGTSVMRDPALLQDLVGA